MSKLFSGKANPFGGLSNERELAKVVPAAFRRDWTTNPWCEYVGHLFYRGGDISDWKWKTDDGDTRKLQMMYFNSLLGGFGLKHEDKIAVAGWMLSEMLTEVPKWSASKVKTKGRD